MRHALHKRWINTSTPWRTGPLPQLVESIALEDHPDEQREIIGQSLDAIANDIGLAMRDAGLDFPIFMTVPASGGAVPTIATSLNSTDEDWFCASAIACLVISNRIGGIVLRSRPLPCALVNSEMAAADVTRKRCYLFAGCRLLRIGELNFARCRRCFTGTMSDKPSSPSFADHARSK
jgi:hypothetical protein